MAKIKNIKNKLIKIIKKIKDYLRKTIKGCNKVEHELMYL